MPKPVTIIKVDPVKRRVVRMSIKPSVQGVRSIIGAADIGHRVLLEDVSRISDGKEKPEEMLLVGARCNQDPDKPVPEWRFRGGENTVGVGILFGTLERKLDGMWHVPVTLEWVKNNVIWCEPGEVAPAAEVAEVLGIPAAQADDEARTHGECSAIND